MDRTLAQNDFGFLRNFSFGFINAGPIGSPTYQARRTRETFEHVEATPVQARTADHQAHMRGNLLFPSTLNTEYPGMEPPVHGSFVPF
ncbi:MAG: hypothetical protein F4Y87_04840 [Synechococcus sp. SB0665_bin_28]|nr:hypothetical protein [Synechococcus sp. SB0665_bin_28]MYF21107.1 hypothetical protein [Synechococcus sp. SB0677_bin_5]